ncbi:hypothetical protein [Pseudothermotoga sp.]|nr:hypothetical protein [Pseudothermotoga sp.]MCX7813771.1 hypothetical protein [Pseudothermotoga sp.]MDW8140589.1 hypothetical protein [Pseudothermotoga sp.]
MIYDAKMTELEKRIELTAVEVFLKSIELLGGLNKLAQHRNLTWLASLARACIAIVLKEDYLKNEESIAEYLGISSATVRNMLKADVETVKKRLEDLDKFSEEEKGELKTHIAGAVAKLAYEIVKRQRNDGGSV